MGYYFDKERFVIGKFADLKVFSKIGWDENKPVNFTLTEFVMG
jgi:hypothetical protein